MPSGSLYIAGYFSYLSQYCSEFVLECREKLAHDSLHIIVCQGLVKVLKHEAECILLLAFCNLVTSVDIKETDLLEKLLANAECALAEVRIAYRLVKEDRKVTPYLWELWKFLVLDLVSLHELEQCRPADFSCKYRLLDAELLQSCRSDCSHHSERLVRTRKVVCKSLREQVCRSSLCLKRIDITAETLEQKLEISLELEIVALARINSPGLVRLTAHEESVACMFLI